MQKNLINKKEKIEQLHGIKLFESNHRVNKEGAKISESSFRDGFNAHSRKWEGDARTLEATPIGGSLRYGKI